MIRLFFIGSFSGCTVSAYDSGFGVLGLGYFQPDIVENPLLQIHDIQKKGVAPEALTQ